MFDLIDKSKVSFHGKNAGTGKLIYVNDTTVAMCSKDFTVYKYLYTVENWKDGDGYHYMAPSYGILKMKSTAKSIEYILHTEDDKLEDTIANLVKSIDMW
jgi:hypothetical protein